MNYIKVSAEVFPLEVGIEIVVAQLANLGFESFVEVENGVEAYIQQKDFKEDLVNEISILKNKNFNINITSEIIEDKNWNEVWEKSFEPITIENKCMIRADFHPPKKQMEYDIIINPKMSFGTGHHQTTYLMIKRLLQLDLQNKTVLDMGCGTGVLAILSKKKGAANVLAIDIDNWAYQNTIENIKFNKMDSISTQLGGAELLKKTKKFDVIFANINRNILLNDMENYKDCLNKKGKILMSGFFTSDKNLIIEKAKQLNLTLNYQDNKEDWSILEFDKK